MVFDSRFQLCEPWNTAYNRKRKQEHLNYFVMGPWDVEGEYESENYSSTTVFTEN